jgi:hypothetical protein
VTVTFAEGDGHLEAFSLNYAEGSIHDPRSSLRDRVPFFTQG